MFLRACLVSMALVGSVFSAQAATVSGTPVVLDNRLIGPVGCSFRCPVGFVFLDSVHFHFNNATGIGPAGWQENHDDNGVLLCFGEQRTVGRTTVPEIPFGLIEVDACNVNYSALGLEGSQSQCNEAKLDECLRYGGGEPCYTKWCE